MTRPPPPIRPSRLLALAIAVAVTFVLAWRDEPSNAQPDAGARAGSQMTQMDARSPDAGSVDASRDAGSAPADGSDAPGRTVPPVFVHDAAVPTSDAVVAAVPRDAARVRRRDAAPTQSAGRDAAIGDAPLGDADLGDGGTSDGGDGGALLDAGLEPDAAVLVDAGEAPPDAIQATSPEAPIVEPPPEGPPASRESTWFTLKVIFGLAVLLAIAYLGGHPRALRLEERLGIRGAVLAGFPYIALGVITSLPSVGILGGDVLPKLRPLLQFGLGWIGFIIGTQLDIRLLDRVPRGSAYLVLVETIAPFAVTAAACGAVMIGWFGLSPRSMAGWRDIVLLGTAAAMTAPGTLRRVAGPTWTEGRGADALLAQLDEIAGVIGLLFIMAYFRSDAMSAWNLPRTAWLFVTVGLGVLLGVLIFTAIRLPRSNAEFLAIVLGAMAFASGFASVLRLSPTVICFIAGTMVANFPNEQRESVFRIFHRLERPIYLLFLMIAGALWSVFDWRGWALVPLFVASRIGGKWLGTALTRASVGTVVPSEFTRGRRLVLPMSPLAIALVVSIERFQDLALNWVVTAVIGSSLIMELFASPDRYGDAAPPPATPAPPPEPPPATADEDPR